MGNLKNPPGAGGKVHEIIVPNCSLEYSELLKEHNLLTAVLGSIGEAVYYTDLDRRILAWNRAAEELTGFSAQEVIGKHCNEVLKHIDSHGEVLCEKNCPLQAVLQGNQAVEAEEILIVTKDGGRKPVEVNCSVVRDESGQILGIVEAFRDRSRQRDLERSKEEFLTIITHDLKSPLASMMGFTELLIDPKYGDISNKKLEFVHNIRHSGDLLLSLISNIAAVSRIEAGQMKYNFENFLLEGLLKELLTTFQPLAEKNKLTLNFTAPPDWVYADKERILQVFHNLISNALRYTPRGGKISISAVPKAVRVEIEVADTGRGIPKAEQGKLFQKFVQVKGERRGTGLGLYIAKNILHAHGSEIKLVSTPGAGTRFFFQLSKGEAPKEAEVRFGKLLIVGNDVDDSAQIAATFLEAQGHSITLAASGIQALQEASLLKPDLILVFNSLPDLTIEEFLHTMQLDSVTLELPIILLSEDSAPEWQKQYFTVVPLPLQVKALGKAVEKILQQSLNLL